MKIETKFLIWLEQTQDKILPFFGGNIKGFDKIFADLSKEEVLRLKRKWRKIYRKILKDYLKECEPHEAKLIKSAYGADEKSKQIMEKSASKKLQVTKARRELVFQHYFRKILKTFKTKK